MVDLRIFVNDGGIGVFLCPRCGTENPVAIDLAAGEPGKHGVVDVSCTCGHRDRAMANQRRAPRVTVTLSGEVVRDEGTRPILVRVLSPLGLGFEAPAGLTCEVGDEVTMELFLEDVGAAVVRKKAVIRSVSDRFVGAEFHVNDPPTIYDQICDRALVVYLQDGDPDGY